MSLAEFASAVLRDQALFLDLSTRPSLNAVIECAHRAGAIGEDEYNALLHMDAGEDFSFFVGPDDTRVRHRRDVKKIPPGAFIAIILVENPKSSRPPFNAPRHLVHALIALEYGLAVGVDHSQISAAHARRRAWSVIDLDRDLVWLDEDQTNGYDLFSGVALGLQAARLLRIRYRMPGRAVPGPAGPGGGAASAAAAVTNWGQPDPTHANALLDAVARAARQPVKLKIEPGMDNSRNPPAEHIFRVNFQFALDNGRFEELFNSPNGLRGHYYADAAGGDAYTRTLLTAIGDAIDWPQVLTDKGDASYFGKAFPAEQDAIIARIKASLTAGKIWFKESKPSDPSPVITGTPWPNAQLREAVNFYPRNSRWASEATSVKGNWRAFLADTRASELRLGKSDYDALELKFTDALGKSIGSFGASYFYCLPPEKAALQAAGTVNLDVKGEWLRANGEPTGTIHPGKHYRAHQIKWFGFT